MGEIIMGKKVVLFFSFVFGLLLLVSCNDKSFTVTFDLNGGVSNSADLIKEVKEGSLVSPIDSPTKDGYTFLYWSLDDAMWDLDVNKVSKNITLIAVYKENEYIVSFNTIGGTPIVEEQKVVHGQKAIRPNDITLEGNKFLGWYYEDVLYDFDTLVTNNLTLTAKWEKEVYTVTFDLNGGIGEDFLEMVTYNELVEEPANPTKEISLFLGWYYEGRKWDFNSPVKGDMSLKARWSIYYDIAKNNLEEYYKDTLGSDLFRPLEDLELIKEINGLPITWTSSNITYVSNEGVITLPEVGEGAISITLTASLTSSYYIDFKFEVLNYNPEEPPTFTFTEDYEDIVKVNWNKSFDHLKGVKVVDNYDGDITNNIVLDNVIDTTNYGLQTVSLSITNSFGKTSTHERVIDVIWDYEVTFIGHAGSYYGLMNSYDAIMYAIEVLKYQAVEVDLKQTKDGVFVLCHDDTFGGYTLAQTNWDVLKDVKITQNRASGIPGSNGSVTKSPYTTGLITLEEFLEICKTHNVDAVIELKHSPGINNGDQSRMPALMDLIEDKQMLNNVVLLSSQQNCLIWTRDNGYEDVTCQFLVTTMESQTFLDRCIEYNLDISANISQSNSDEWIARYKANGIKVAVYTFNQYQDYNVIQQWIDKGVDYVTTDWHIMSELNLKEIDNEPKETFKVTFKDYDGKVLKVSDVEEGSSALEPTGFDRLGYEFTGWSESILNVTSNLTVTATYQIKTYTITYDANVYTTELVSFTNKEEFINEFYNDFYSWLLNYGKDLEGITVSGNAVKVNLNDQEVTINDANELKAVDIYVFEKTFANFIYKPFNRVSNEAVLMEESLAYFLNTSPYKIKYETLDAWFLGAMVNNYTGYDRGYNQASSGRVQIMFRFQQWQKGTSIAQFNTLPLKTIIITEPDFNYQLPSEPKTYTVIDEILLPSATGDKEFLGWYLDSNLTVPITKIELGTTENIKVYAKWED